MKECIRKKIFFLTSEMKENIIFICVYINIPTFIYFIHIERVNL